MNNYTNEQLKQIIYLLYLGLNNLDSTIGVERESVEMALESLANYQFSNALEHLKMGHAASDKASSVSSRFAGAIENFQKQQLAAAKKRKVKPHSKKSSTKTFRQKKR